ALPAGLGTNVHTLKLAFCGNEIAGYCDGVLETTYTDNSAYLSGSVSLDMYTSSSGYEMTVGYVEVDPLAKSDSYSVVANNSLTIPAPGVLTNDTGVFGTNLTAVVAVPPANGVLNLNTNGGFTYTPAMNFSGTDIFSYQASDIRTNLGIALVNITVSPSAGPPSLPAQPNITVDELAALVITNTATDPDVPPLTLTYDLVSAPANAGISTNGIITWTPNQAQAPSTNVFTTVVSDNGSPVLSATNSFMVVVNDLNSAPVLPVQTNHTIIGLQSLVVTN